MGIPQVSTSSQKCNCKTGLWMSVCTPTRTLTLSNTSIKCLHTSECSIGNKQEELNICGQSKGFDLTAVMETWWDTSHDWNVVMRGHTLLRKDRPGGCIGGTSLYVRKLLECIELYLR